MKARMRTKERETATSELFPALLPRCRCACLSVCARGLRPGRGRQMVLSALWKRHVHPILHFLRSFPRRVKEIRAAQEPMPDPKYVDKRPPPGLPAPLWRLLLFPPQPAASAAGKATATTQISRGEMWKQVRLAVRDGLHVYRTLWLDPHNESALAASGRLSWEEVEAHQRRRAAREREREKKRERERAHAQARAEGHAEAKTKQTTTEEAEKEYYNELWMEEDGEVAREAQRYKREQLANDVGATLGGSLGEAKEDLQTTIGVAKKGLQAESLKQGVTFVRKQIKEQEPELRNVAKNRVALVGESVREFMRGYRHSRDKELERMKSRESTVDVMGAMMQRRFGFDEDMSPEQKARIDKLLDGTPEERARAEKLGREAGRATHTVADTLEEVGEAVVRRTKRTVTEVRDRLAADDDDEPAPARKKQPAPAPDILDRASDYVKNQVLTYTEEDRKDVEEAKAAADEVLQRGKERLSRVRGEWDRFRADETSAEDTQEETPKKAGNKKEKE